MTVATPTPVEAAHASATYAIGELAEEFGLTTRAIRFYEKCGLLSPLRDGRHRIYSARDRARLKLTLRGKRLGLRLVEIKQLLDMYETPRDTQAQLRAYLGVLLEYRQQMEQQLSDLHLSLDEIRAQEAQVRLLLDRNECAA